MLAGAFCKAVSPWRLTRVGASLAGEAAILSELRDALALNFGDFGLGAALASLQGAARRGGAGGWVLGLPTLRPN